MNPSDAHSSLATLRQLKEMLDAGTLTPQEFEALKQKLVFGKDAAAEAAEPAAVATDFVAPVSISEALTSAPAFPGEVSLPPAPPDEAPAWLAAAAPLPAETPSAPLASDYADTELDTVDNQRNPLNLIFAIGGALVFLAVVLYLTLGNRSADEHLTSTTQTAADSTAVAPEVGPQAQQLTLPPAAPETVRVAPTAPPVVAPVAATKFRTDSAATATTAPSAPAKTVVLPGKTVTTDSTSVSQP